MARSVCAPPRHPHAACGDLKVRDLEWRGILGVHRSPNGSPRSLRTAPNLREWPPPRQLFPYGAAWSQAVGVAHMLAHGSRGDATFPFASAVRAHLSHFLSPGRRVARSCGYPNSVRGLVTEVAKHGTGECLTCLGPCSLPSQHLRRGRRGSAVGCSKLEAIEWGTDLARSQGRSRNGTPLLPTGCHAGARNMAGHDLCITTPADSTGRATREPETWPVLTAKPSRAS